MAENITTEPVQVGLSAEYPREWGRTEHVYQQFGIKRGTLYNLYSDGRIRGKELRVRGQLKGVRLWDMDSIRRYIEAQPDNLDEKEKAPTRNWTGP